MRYRVWMVVPGSDKPIQAICATQKMAEEFLRLVLDTGQPKGTTWKILRSDEKMLQEGVVE